MYICKTTVTNKKRIACILIFASQYIKLTVLYEYFIDKTLSTNARRMPGCHLKLCYKTGNQMFSNKFKKPDHFV